MAFQRTEASIRGIMNSGVNVVGADIMLGMLVDLVKDIQDYNENNLDVKDNVTFAKNISALMDYLMKLYQDNEQALKDLHKMMLEKLNSLGDEVMKAEKELEATIKAIDDNETVNEKLKEKLQELQQSRGHLLDLKKNYEELKVAIAELSDEKLDRLADEKNKLEEELKDRKARKQKLELELSQHWANLEELEKDYSKATEENNELSNRIAALNDDLHNKEEEKKQLNKRIQEIVHSIEKLREWINGFEEQNKERLSSYENLKKKEELFTEAWNALSNQDLVKEHLLNNSIYNDESQSIEFDPASFHEEVVQPIITPEKLNTFEEIDKSFADMNSFISGMLDIYRKRLDLVLTKAESLTK